MALGPWEMCFMCLCICSQYILWSRKIKLHFNTLVVNQPRFTLPQLWCDPTGVKRKQLDLRKRRRDWVDANRMIIKDLAVDSIFVSSAMMQQMILKRRHRVVSCKRARGRFVPGLGRINEFLRFNPADIRDIARHYRDCFTS